MSLYYFIAARLPRSFAPLGRIWAGVRHLLARGFLQKCGKDVTLEYGIYFGDGRDVSMGDHVQINESCRIRNVAIGNYVMIAPEVMILNLGHNTEDTSVPMMTQGIRRYPQTVIEDDVWIGARALIMPGVRIE